MDPSSTPEGYTSLGIMETGSTQNRAVFAFGVDPKYGTAFSSSSTTTGVSSTPLASPHSQSASNNYLQVQNPRNNASQPNNYSWSADALSSKSSSSTVSPSPSPGVGRLPSRGFHPDGESRGAGGHARSASHSGAVESFLGSQNLLNPQQPLFSTSSSPSGSSVPSPQNLPHHLTHRSLARSGSTSGNVSDNGDSPLSVQSRGLPPGAPGAISMAAGSSIQRGSPDIKTNQQSNRGIDYSDNVHGDPAHNDASSSNSDDGAHHDNQHMGGNPGYYGEAEGEQYYSQQQDDQEHASMGMMAASIQQQQQLASMGLSGGMYGNRNDGFEVNMMNMQGNVGAGMMNAAGLMGGDNGLMFPNGNTGVNSGMLNPAAAALLLRQQQQQQQQQAQQMMANAAMFNTAICKFYAQGHCGRGEHCNFAHISPTKGMGMNVAAATLAAANGQSMMMNQMAMNLGMMQSMDRRDRGRGRDKGRGRFDGNMRGGMNPRNARSMDFRGMPNVGNMSPLDISMMAANRMPRGMPMGPNGSGPSSPNFGQAMTGPAGGSHTRHLSAMNMRSVSTGGGMNPLYFNKGGMAPRSVGGLGLGGAGNYKDKRGFQPNPMYRDGRSPDGRGPMMGGMPGGKMYGSGGKYSPEVGGGMHGRHASAGSLGMMMPYNDYDDGFLPQGDFLSKFPPNPTIEDLTGHIYSLAKDQYGCRLLQKMLDEQKQRVVSIIFKEAFDHMNELMTDPFGNYLCQKLIEHCYENQRLAVIEKVSPDLVAISLNIHGTRAVQKLVETVSLPKEVELVVRALQSSVVTLIKDLNGNHVIQRCLHHLNAKDNQFIYDAVANHLVSVATHKHGCCVLQRCIDYATQKQKKQLVLEIIRNSLELVQDAFGNYVVQYVLDLGENATNQSIIASLLGSVSSLSVQKFSSNVVEKCLELADDNMRSKLIDELTNVERLPRLLQDPYANYVIQRALTVSKKNQFERLVEVIKPHLTSLRNTSFGKRIQNKILKKFPDFRLSYEVGMDDPHLLELYNSVQHMQLGDGGDVDDGYAERERQRQMDNPFLRSMQQQQQQQAYLQQYNSGMGMMNQSAVDSGYDPQMLMQQQQQQQQQQAQFGSYAYGDALEPAGDSYEQPRSDPDLHVASQLHYGVSDGGVSSSSGSGSEVIQPGGRRFGHHQHSHSLSSSNAFHLPAQSPISQVTGSDMPNGSGGDSADQPLAIGSRSSSSSSNVSNNNNNGAGPTRGPIRVPSASPLPQQQQQQQQRFGAFPSSTPSHMRHLSGSLLNGQQ